jgi:GxxExxY protein
MSLLFEKETYKIIGLAQDVHNELGSGFLEVVYHDALEVEFKRSIMPYKREFPISIYYKNEKLNRTYYADFYCYDKIIVEVKAKKSITNIDYAQTLHYLKATNKRLGLLINFGELSLKVKRIING